MNAVKLLPIHTRYRKKNSKRKKNAHHSGRGNIKLFKSHSINNSNAAVGVWLKFNYVSSESGYLIINVRRSCGGSVTGFPFFTCIHHTNLINLYSKEKNLPSTRWFHS